MLESAAAHNRAKGRTVLERTQQGRADRLREVLAATRTAEGADKRDALTAAARDVLAERRRQVDAEHRTLEEDDAMTSGQMATVAGYYALASGHPHERDLGRGTVPSYWPWTAEWWKPRDRRRNLVRAGALILAEVERLDRATNQPSAQVKP